MRDLGALWFDEIADSDRSPSTVARYREVYDRAIVPGVGELRIREATVPAMDRFLKATAKASLSTARHARVILSGMLGMAVRHGAIRTDPIREVAAFRSPKSEVRALSVDDVRALREGVRGWVDDPEQAGRRRNPDIPDVVDILLATGARIGELCALRWDDVDLAAERPTVTISGTVVRVPGEGIIRQDHPKTAAGHRTVTLPRFAVETLMRRRVESGGTPNPMNLVFPSTTGTLRETANLHRQWRDARAAAGFDWVVPHTFRKTVATMIDREYSTRDAASQLGHSGTAVTAKHYVAKAIMAPDVSAALEPLGEP
ncbi:site-specific integrase [Agromyces endophyticus]|uniref:site-specific integrase n=1 Tax=Agromyces sp. H17E-10 TaxID=2932244 RepID=UPI001FD2760A|nr:site-specific integrase [Agromyces sp. H17E-10]UOQ90689.1 site-specific integrase [Agromyces sp. H17E-10]